MKNLTQSELDQALKLLNKERKKPKQPFTRKPLKTNETWIPAMSQRERPERLWKELVKEGKTIQPK